MSPYLFLAGLTLLVGCSIPRVPPVEDVPSFWLQQKDLTGGYPRVPEFQVVVLTTMDEYRLLEELRSHLSITQLGSNSNPNKIEMVTRRIETGGASVVAILASGAELVDGWYELRSTADISKHVRPEGFSREYPDGSIGLRFRVGLEPVVASVSVCNARDNANPLVQVRFSEPVNTSGSWSSAVRVTDADSRQPLACRDRAPANLPNPFMDTWTLDCGSLPARIEIATADAVRNSAGMPVREFGTANEFREVWAWESLPRAGECWTWVPE